MSLYPAIDILGGNAVRLVKGDFDAKKVYDEDPLSAARGWVEAGARLPARRRPRRRQGGRAGQPRAPAADRRRAGGAGAVRRRAALAATRSRDALEAGAARVILGTAAFTDPELLREALRRARPGAGARVGGRARRARRDRRLDADHRRSAPREAIAAPARAQACASSSTPTSIATGCSKAPTSTRSRASPSAVRRAADLLGRHRRAGRPARRSPRCAERGQPRRA